MQLALYSDLAITLAQHKAARKADILPLEAAFRLRETAFIGGTVEGFMARVTEAIAYVAAAYPTIDEDVYPLLFDEAADTGTTATVVADALIVKYRLYTKVNEEANKVLAKAYRAIDAHTTFGGTTGTWFDYRNAFLGTAHMGVTINKPYIVPRPYELYEGVTVLGNGVDTLTINLPTPSLIADVKVTVMAYDPGNPWHESSTVVYTNPGPVLNLTFTNSSDPLYVDTDFRWRITITGAPMVATRFYVHGLPP